MYLVVETIVLKDKTVLWTKMTNNEAHAKKLFSALISQDKALYVLDMWEMADGRWVRLL